MAPPKSVLFACQLNSVRSPIAAALLGHSDRSIRTGSAGVQQGELDPFAVAVMDEAGFDISRHKPRTFEELEDLEDGLHYDLIVTLSPGAHHRALDLARGTDIAVEYWPTPDATGIEGNREQRLDAYRAVRDHLLAKIRERFGAGRGGNE